MYSNLRTAGAYNNHLFIPASLRVMPYMDDVIRIEASNHPVLTTYVGTPFGMVRPMFDEVVQAPASRTVYVVNGQQLTLDSDDERPAAPSYLRRKLLGYRPVDTGPVSCTH